MNYFFCQVHYFINGFLNCGFFGLADFLSFFKGKLLFCLSSFLALCSFFWVRVYFLSLTGKCRVFLFFRSSLFWSLLSIVKKSWGKTYNWVTLGCCCWCSGSPKDRRDFKRVAWVTLFFFRHLYVPAGFHICKYEHIL